MLKHQKDKFWKKEREYVDCDDDDDDKYDTNMISHQQTLHSPTTTTPLQSKHLKSTKTSRSHKKLPAKNDKKQRAQSNKFFSRDSRYLKSRKKHKKDQEDINTIKRTASSVNTLSEEQDERRLSVMDSACPSDINEFKIEEEFVNDSNAPFGNVTIVSTGKSPNTPYLLQLVNQSDIYYDTAIAVMSRMKHLINPYIITQIERGQHFSTEWCSYNCPSNGSLTNCLHLFRNVSITSVRILIAEVLCALEYLHECNFNFPNLSPETIYISHKSHIVLTDFGFAIPNNRKNEIYRSGPLCYAPPEFLLNGVDDIKSDWWRLGVLMYHLIVGRPPFMGDRQTVCHQICSESFVINSEQLFGHCSDLQIDEDAKDLVLGLLTRDRTERYGCNTKKRPAADSQRLSGIDEIMQHPFFECICNKKNKEYQFTWPDIQKRQHMAAPILRHLSTRATDSPRDYYRSQMQSDKDGDEEHVNVRETSNDSLVDTTDDEEYALSDEEEEKSIHHQRSMSKSKGNITPIRNSPENYNFGTLSGSGSYAPSPLNTASLGTSPPINVGSSTLSSYSNNGLHPLAQSPPPPPPPPIAVHDEVGSFPTNYDRSISPKKSRHRKQLSTKLETIPTRALPPPPSGSKTPQLQQSVQSAELNGLCMYFN